MYVIDPQASATWCFGQIEVWGGIAGVAHEHIQHHTQHVQLHSIATVFIP